MLPENDKRGAINAVYRLIMLKGQEMETSTDSGRSSHLKTLSENP
jgi:hypothetical protein